VNLRTRHHSEAFPDCLPDTLRILKKAVSRFVTNIARRDAGQTSHAAWNCGVRVRIAVRALWYEQMQAIDSLDVSLYKFLILIKV
jgi:hypothetical protein